jgi:hypothetical protein
VSGYLSRYTDCQRTGRLRGRNWRSGFHPLYIGSPHLMGTGGYFPWGEVKWGYFTTDGQSVSMSWYRAPLLDLRPDITSCRKDAAWNLRSCYCGAPSMTRGRVKAPGTWKLTAHLHLMVRSWVREPMYPLSLTFSCHGAKLAKHRANFGWLWKREGSYKGRNIIVVVVIVGITAFLGRGSSPSVENSVTFVCNQIIRFSHLWFSQQ